MSDLFISYSSKDRKTTRALVKTLEKNGMEVWWDKHIPPGKTFDRVISAALDSAKCIVVLWSEHSVRSDWVIEEALEGMERKILVPVQISTVRLPFGFRRLQAINLARWRGGDSSPPIRKLVEAARGFIGPEPAAKGPKRKTEPVRRRKKRKLTGALDGKTIVFTGALSETRDAHSEKVRTVGARYVNSVSRKTDFLVVGKEPGATKLAAAEKLGTRKISEKQWLKILNEAYLRILGGKTIVFTGKLDQPRSRLEAMARKLGARPVGSVSGNTNYLVVGSAPGAAKLKAAKEHNVEVISENIWEELAATLQR